MPRPPRRALLASLLVIGPAGCEAGGPGLAGAPPLEARRELRIGSVDDPATLLTRVGRMAVDDGGWIYTSHPQESVVLVHDARGARVATIGGAGEGPGEFRAVDGIGLVGDTLWALDRRLYRITYFSPAGELQRSVRVPIDLGTDPVHSPPRPTGLLADGRLVGTPAAWSHAVASGDLAETPLLLMDTAGVAGDTLCVVPHTIWAIQDPSGAMRFGTYRAQPFADQPLVALDPAGPACVVLDREVAPAGEPAVFRVSRVRSGGDTVFSRAFAYDAVPIDPAVPDSLVADWAERFRERPLGGLTVAEAAALARADLHVPAHHPPVGAVVVGRDGAIWLRGPQPDPGRAAWLVLDRDGGVIGRVELPGRLQVEVAERGRVWGVEQDELDVPWIVRYAVGGGDADP
ncbi:MAG TPA: hypothetical protein VMM12_00135 [Longimicrobiales bacterium]|nr:hypothetical protein [Longimicrobiales bacterium]